MKKHRYKWLHEIDRDSGVEHYDLSDPLSEKTIICITHPCTVFMKPCAEAQLRQQNICHHNIQLSIINHDQLKEKKGFGAAAV